MSTMMGIAGAGTMGRGMAETALLAGFSVVMIDINAELAGKGYEAVAGSLARGVERGRITPEHMTSALGRLTVGAIYDLLSGCEVVIEAVAENIEVKKQVLSSVSAVVSKDALLGSNTSSLSISEMSLAVRNPERFCGIHFFNPVPVMKLVEIIPGERTRADTVDRAVDLCRKLGKTPVTVRESPGFIVNRLLCPLMNEAAYLVMEGVASRQDIDTAMKLGANHPIGPLALADLVGIDVLYAIMDVLYREFGDPKYRPCPILKDMVEVGHLGRKTGQGFFTY